MEKIYKRAFCVIGMPGSTDDGEDFVQKLWEKANSRFVEVEPLASRNEDGSLIGNWGIMTDMDFTYGPGRMILPAGAIWLGWKVKLTRCRRKAGKSGSFPALKR